jgi:cytochrome c biogenesis protein CcmG/thiol:disulfide interchange protein DsbE
MTEIMATIIDSARFMVAVICLAFLGQQFASAEQAPSFSLADSEGETITLDDFGGRPLILHFWASWCPYCKKLQPGLEQLALDNKGSGLVVMGISFREDEGVLPQEVLSRRGHSFKTLIDGDAAAKAYGVKGTPTTFFINRKGEIISVTNTSNPKDPALVSMTAAIVQ